jgi:hypothetical protein
MKKLEDLREQRAELLAKLKRERDDELGCRAEIERQIKELEARRAKKMAELDGLAKEADKTLIELDRKIRHEEAEQHVAEFFDVAAALDERETPERLARWKHLIAVLRSCKRLGQSHEAAMMTTDRLRGVAKGFVPLKANTFTATAHSWVKQAAA